VGRAAGSQDFHVVVYPFRIIITIIRRIRRIRTIIIIIISEKRNINENKMSFVYNNNDNNLHL